MMAGCFVCQTRIDLEAQINALYKSFDDVISGRGLALDHESFFDRACRLAECRAVIEHTRGIQRELARHTREHGCGCFPCR